MQMMERRYGDDPGFRRARTSLDSFYQDYQRELGFEKELIGCYGEHLDNIQMSLSRTTESSINERYAEFKSDFFSTSMAFFSSISDQLTQYMKGVGMRLRRLPAEMKTSLLNYMRDLWIERIYPTLQSFIDKIDKVAKALKVDTYSVSLEYAFISVSFSFKPVFKP